MADYPLIEVRADAAIRIEQLGTKQKFWFNDPHLGLCLCKLARPGTGESWSEKIASEIASVLGLACARYELGVFDGHPCIVSPIFVPASCSLVHGNELLRVSTEGYGTDDHKFLETGHRLEAVWDALSQFGCELPLNWTPPPEIRQAAEVFTGYLLLDALVGNTDRHHENWAVIEAPEEAAGRRHLAPTYDHAACLGFHLGTSEVEARLHTRDKGYSVEAYANRARSAFFRLAEDRRPMTTMEAFLSAAEQWPKAATVWQSLLEALTRDGFQQIISRCGRVMSPHAREFAQRMLVHNRNRLLDSTTRT